MIPRCCAHSLTARSAHRKLSASGTRRSRAEATRLKKQGLPLEGAREGRFFYGSAPDARDSRAGLAVVPELPFLRAVAPQKTTLGIGVGCMRRRGLIPLNAIPTTS